MHYLFDLKCPRCNKVSMLTLPSKDTPMLQLNCGHCLMDEVKLIPLDITSVTVIDGDAGVDLFHELQLTKEQFHYD